MGKYRKGLDIKKTIIKLLRKKPMVLSELERTLKTGSKVIQIHTKELEYLGIVSLRRHKRHPHNKRPYTVASLKNPGKSYFKLSFFRR